MCAKGVFLFLTFVLPSEGISKRSDVELDRGIILEWLEDPLWYVNELWVLVLLPEYTLTESWLILEFVKVGYIILSD